MPCEKLLSSQNQVLNLSVIVRVPNLDAPRSEDELKNELLAHALDCHECLTVFLFQSGSLADDGCPAYRRLFLDASEELLLSVAAGSTTESNDCTHPLFYDHVLRGDGEEGQSATADLQGVLKLNVPSLGLAATSPLGSTSKLS